MFEQTEYGMQRAIQDTRGKSLGTGSNKSEQERPPHPSSFKTQMPWIYDRSWPSCSGAR